MRVHICGVRGSTPAPGADFVRYGGNTCCVAISRDGALPTLVLDAGTGLQRLAAVFGAEPFVGTILLSHLHWDHTHGLPFFPPGDRPGARVRLLMPAQGGADRVLEQLFSPPHFPITIDELRGEWHTAGLDAGHHDIEGFRVVALDIPHKGGRTFGFRVSDGTTSLAYLPDHSPTNLGPGDDGHGALHDAALELVRDVDVLLHDAQYTAEEFATRRGFGHSTIDYAVGLARAAGARQLVLFHHDPRRTDDALDDLVRRCDSVTLAVTGAAEGTVLELLSGRTLNLT